MKTNLLPTLAAAILMTAIGSIPLAAEEVQFKNLPPAVQNTINSQVGAAGIASIQRITRNGIPLYEVRLSKPANAKPLYVSATGSVINLDNVIATQPAAEGSRKATFAELPAPVQNTVRAQAGNAQIEDVDVTTKNGRTTYEVAFKRDGQPVELVVDPQGAVLSGGQPASVSQARVPLAAASKATFNELPAPVQNTLRTYSLGAPIEDIDKGTLQGRTVYQAAFKHGGQNVELRVAEDGSLIRDDVNDQYLAKIGRAPISRAVGTQSPSWLATTDWQSAPERRPLNAATKVSFREMPTAVRDTLRTYAGTARIEDIDKGTLAGQTVYEAAFKHGNQNIELRVAEDGSLVRDQANRRFLAELGRQVPAEAVGRAPSWEALTRSQSSSGTALADAKSVRFNQLPPAVQTTLRAQAEAAAIDRITQGTLNGKTVYEAAFQRDGKHVIVRVNPDGSLVQ